MHFSLKWLQKFFSKPLSSIEMSRVLTEAGLEVDAVSKRTPSFEKVVVVSVTQTQKHPDADRLCIATVHDGENDFQVVCGASNCKSNLRTALAPVGASLTDSKGKRHIIKKGVLRGVESQGMLVSLEELGLEEKSEGIVELSSDYPIGDQLAPHFEDEILEISFTPNLGHAMSHLGIARELSCHLNLDYQIPKLKPLASPQATASSFKLKVSQPELCPAYGGILIKNVEVKPSPLWLRNLLESLKISSVNNVVDITNYILHEIGQPMHAFDADKICSASIRVESIPKSQEVTTLDGQKRLLKESTLAICDSEKIIAIAGVMGLQNTAVSAETQNIFIEAARFDPSTIRKSSKSLALYTDASKHFERGIDSKLFRQALQRAASLILEIAGGEVVGEGIFFENEPPKDRSIQCRIKRVNTLLGTDLSQNEAIKLLTKLEFSCQKIDELELQVQVPSYRNDIHIEVDLIEEIARAYGINKLHNDQLRYSPSSLSDDLTYQFEKRVHHLLLKQGLQEVISCDLISPEMESWQKKGHPLIQVMNSMSQEQSTLRSSLLANHLQILKHNQDRQNANMHIFEIGTVYHQEGERYLENHNVCVTLMGSASHFHFESKDTPLDFFDLKGIIENLFMGLKIPGISYKRSDSDLMHPGVQAKIELQTNAIGFLGQVHPSHLRKIGLKQPVYFAEIKLAPLFAPASQPFVFKEIPSFPSSERDWTLTAKEDLQIGDLFNVIHCLPSRLLKDVSLLDLYRSEKIGKDRKNVTLRFVYRNDKKTISFEAVEVEHARIISEVQQKMKNLLIQPS